MLLREMYISETTMYGTLRQISMARFAQFDGGNPTIDSYWKDVTDHFAYGTIYQKVRAIRAL